MAEIVDRVYVELNGETIDANSIDEKITGNKEPVKVMNRKNRAVSHKHGVPDIALTIEFPMDQDLTTKFKQALANNTRFTTTVEAEGEDGTSKTTSYLDCEIYEVNVSAKEGDGASISLEVQALDFVET
jgi:hypothetical protein